MHVRRSLAATRPLAALAATTAMALGQTAPPLLGRLPDAAPIVAECGDAGALWHGGAAAIGALPEGLPQAVRAQIAALVLAVRTFFGGAPAEVLGQLAGGGFAFGLVPTDGRPVPLLVLRPGDAAAARALLGRLPQHPAWCDDGDTLLVSSTADGLALVRASAAAARAGTPSRWADWPDARLPEAGELRAYVDLAALRERLPALQRVGVEHLDGGGRFLLSPLVHALATATHATLSLRATTDGVELTAQADGTVLGSPWQALLPTAGAERRVPTAPAGALGMLCLDRSLRTLLAEPARFLDEAGVLAVQSFVSVADQVDGARSQFVADIVGSVREPIAVYLLPTAPPDDEPCPPLLLPGLAFAAPLASERGERDLLRTASAFALIANVERARKRQSTFALRPVRDGFVHGVTAVPRDWRGPGLPPLDQGLSPTLLFGHGHAVLATTLAAARGVLDRIADGTTRAVRGDLLQLSGTALATALLQNRAPLELARQLDEGETAAQAAQFVATLAAALQVWPHAELELRPEPAATTLRLSLRNDQR